MNLEIEKYLIPMIKLVSCYTHLDITDPDKAIHLRLDADLLIYGQDAEDLLDDYAEKFKVKDGGFQFEKYLKRGNYFFFMPPMDSEKRISELRIVHLVLGAIKGELSDELIMNYNKENNLE